MKAVVGKIFSFFAYIMGVPMKDANTVGTLLGTKFILNEMLGYIDLGFGKTSVIRKKFYHSKFCAVRVANLSSIAIQIGGIGELAPNQRKIFQD